MIKEKYITPIAIISILICACLLMGYFIPSTKQDINQISQPEYINKVFNKDKVNEIEITVDEKDWQSLVDNALKKEYIMGDITINGETFSSVGIRPKGNSSLKMVASSEDSDRYSLKIDFHEYIKNQTYYGLEKLALNNCISDPTYMKEYLSYEMFSKMGVATPACSYAHIKINGEEWGLYLAVEVMEESFIERYFGSAEGNLYKPESTDAMGENPMPKGQKQNKKRGNQKEGENIKNPKDGSNNKVAPNMARGGTDLVYNGDELSNYAGIFDNAVFNTTSKKDNYKVIEMIKNLNKGTNLENYLDVDEILRYFAVNTFLVNLDSYAGNLKHNYYLYERDGVFQILPWDLNMSFAGFQVRDAKSAVNFPIDTPVSGDSMENSPLISKLLEVDKYKQIYHKYLRALVNDYINSGEYEATINKIDNSIGDYVKKDPTAFYTYEQYQSSLPALRQFGKDRAKSVIAQLEGQQPSTSYGTIETSVDLSLLGSMDMGGKAGNPGDREQDNVPMGNKPFDPENMPNPEVMDEIMNIIRDVKDGELTEDKKSRLVKLGLTDTQIEQILKIKNQMPLGTDEKQSQREFEQGRNEPSLGPPGNRLQYGMQKEVLIVLATCIVALLIALVFVTNFKRRKNM